MPRTVLITGAGGGLGQAIATQMARDGDHVVGTVRDEARAQSLSEEAASQGLSLRYESLELTSPESRDALIQRLGGPVDVLVNNAGFGIYGALEEVSDDRAAQQIAVNLTAPLALTRALLPGLRKTRGCVVWIGSLGGRFALPFQSHYSATKAAIAATSDALRMELKPLGVRVTCVEPGDFATGFTDARDWGESPESAYAEASARCREAVERTERNEGEDPSVVARLVSRLSRMNNPPARRPVGRWARTLVFLQRLLPEWLRERLVAGTYDQ